MLNNCVNIPGISMMHVVNETLFSMISYLDLHRLIEVFENPKDKFSKICLSLWADKISEDLAPEPSLVYQLTTREHKR